PLPQQCECCVMPFYYGPIGIATASRFISILGFNNSVRAKKKQKYKMAMTLFHHSRELEMVKILLKKI
ncbi:MAG: hypothetical protein AAB560_01570, partial [Patescibacteria group bacterium]